jgi:N-acetylneuraminic acid mutarotase
MAADTATGMIVLFGGHMTSGSVGDTWSYSASTDTWAKLSVTAAPSARAGAGLAWDSAAGRYVLFGGGLTSTTYTNTAYSFNPTTATWAPLALSGGPSARAEAGFSYDPVDNLLVLLAGYGPSGYLADTWLLEGPIP